MSGQRTRSLGEYVAVHVVTAVLAAAITMTMCLCFQVNAITGGLFTSEIMEAAAKSKDVTHLDHHTCHMTCTTKS